MPAGPLVPLVVCCIGFYPMVTAFGQAPSDSTAGNRDSAERREAAPEPVQSGERKNITASTLDTFFLRDSKGNLVPVVGLPFEEFERLLQIQRGLVPAPPPGFVISRLHLDGSVEGDVAKFKLSLAIQIREEGWVAVPIGLAAGVIGRPVKYDGPGEHLLAPDQETNAYVCWLNGKDDRLHELSCDVSFRVESAGAQRRIVAGLPLATESVLRLKLAQTAADASLEAGDGILNSETLPNQGSLLTVLGASDELILAWSESGYAAGSLAERLEANAEITVRIESEQRITSEARLRLRSIDRPLERFIVSLPKGMEWAPSAPAADYTVTPVADETERAKSDSPQRVRVQFNRPTTSVSEVLLRAQRQSGQKSTAGFSPADFVVEGAIRQRGTIEFISEGDWQLDWSHEEAVHRSDLMPDATNRQVAARYEYFRQPCELLLQVAARPARLSVEPTHMVYVDSRQMRVETLLKCRFRGARAAGLRVQMGAWKFDRLTPDTLFDLPIVGTEGDVVVPFRDGAQVPAEIELKLEAHCVTGTDSDVAFQLPQCAANNVAAATVVVFAADNVELTPRVAEIVGLSPDPTSVRLPGRQQAPLVYRDLGGGEPARFVAAIRTLTRITTVGGKARARIEGQQIQIEQRLDYRVAHEPQRVFPLLGASEIISAGNLQAWHGDEPLPISPVAAEEVGSSIGRLSFSMPADQIGPFQVSVRYTLPLRWNRSEPYRLTVPLVTPVVEGEDQFTGQQIEFSLGENLQLEPEAAADDEQQPVLVPGAALAYSWSNPVHTSMWVLESSGDSQGSGIVVSQMWAQTWLSPRIRQERVALRVLAEGETILIRIDKSVKQSSVQTAVDGRKVPRTFRQAGVLVVNLPAAVRGRECVIELSYTVEPPTPWLGIMHNEWQAALIEDAQPPRRVYWQLVLPGDEHLLVGPTDLAAEMIWPTTDRWFTSRRPIFDQRQLEAWIKATPQEPLPRSANEYLYGSLSSWPTPQVTIVHRQTLILAASGLVLIVGLLLIHVPALRRSELLLVGSLALAGGAGLAPQIALLAAQASTFGLIVALAAAIWSWAIRSRAPLASGHSTATSPHESRSTRPPARLERSSRVTSTAPGHAAIVEVRS